MRTLKKTLCLVLCLAMMAGLCAVCASAEFTDEADIEYKEAVAVLTGIGVINGFEDGSFQPDGTLNRAQACKIMAVMLGIDEFAGDCTFEDCKNHWAAKYIAACAAEGIVNGYDEATFGPDDELTGVAWAKMLLCAAGYDAELEGLTGADWQYNTIKLAKNKTIGLCNGLAAGFDITAAVSRDEACEMAFNALFVENVEYPSTGVTIKTDDVEITTGASKADPNGEYIADNFPKLENTTATADDDAYGRDVINQWSVNGKPVYTEYEEADWCYAVPRYQDHDTFVKAIAAAYAKESGLKAADLTIDIDPTWRGFAGEVYEFSFDKATKTLSYENCTYYDYYEVIDVKDTKDKDVEYTKDIKVGNVFDGTTVVYTLHEDELTVDVAKGDVIAVPDAYESSGYIWADAVVLEGVQGKMTAYNSTTETATIGGQKLVEDFYIKDPESVISSRDFASTLTYYVSPRGFLAVVEVFEEAFEYEAKVGYAMKFQSIPYNSGSEGDLLGTGASATVEGRAVIQILDMDGTVTVYDLAVKQDAKKGETTYTGKYSEFTGVVGTEKIDNYNKFVAYYVNEDGAVVVVGREDPETVETKKATLAVEGEKANSKTVVHIVEKDDAGKYTAKEIVGYKNFVDAKYETAFMVVGEDGYVSDIYAVNVAAVAPEVVPTLAYCAAIGDETADGTEVTFVVDGEEVNYLFTTAYEVEDGEFYELVVDEKGVVTDDTKLATPDYYGEIEDVDDAFIVVDGDVVEFLKNSTTYDLTDDELALEKGTFVVVFNLTADTQVIFMMDDYTPIAPPLPI